MQTTIKGIYDHGKIILTEEPPAKAKAEVMVTFQLEDKNTGASAKQKIILGLLEGKIKLPDDFNEPLGDLKEYM